MYYAFRLALVGWLAVGVSLAPAAAQTTTPIDQVAVRTPSCREITAQIPIDGQPQTVSGLACLQGDGTWHLVPSDYPPPAYAYTSYTWYDDPWYWWPVAGFGADFFFVDVGFHHRHFFDHRFAHPVDDEAGFHHGMREFRGGGHHR